MTIVPTDYAVHATAYPHLDALSAQYHAHRQTPRHFDTAMAQAHLQNVIANQFVPDAFQTRHTEAEARALVDRQLRDRIEGRTHYSPDAEPAPKRRMRTPEEIAKDREVPYPFRTGSPIAAWLAPK